MKLSKFKLLLITVFITCSSCEKDFIEINNEGKNVKSTVEGVSQLNGRLYFASKEIFTQEYEKFQGKDDDEIYTLVSKLHGKNFIS